MIELQCLKVLKTYYLTIDKIVYYIRDCQDKSNDSNKYFMVYNITENKYLNKDEANRIRDLINNILCDFDEKKYNHIECLGLYKEKNKGKK
ncbi:MAG: hypothetical protein PWQ43_757 [Rikenellaceae bacterium]|nr:hypothetical protein [Rikenellaceae bacterium]